MLKLIRGFFICLLFLVILGTIQLITNVSLSTKSDELNIFVYNDFLDSDMIDSFTEETGIKVNLHFFNSNEELITKIQITKGEGYDLFFPTDYACKILAEDGYLQPIDKSKLNFLDRIYPFLLKRSFDPSNTYSIPYMWEGYGIAYDPEIVTKNDFFIQDYFNPEYKKVMTPDFIEAINIASYHLFKDQDFLTGQDKDAVSKLLKTQKETTEAYADFRSKDIITSKNASLALLKTSYLDEMKAENPDLEFTLPKDKFFASIENTVISKGSKNTDNVYTFLNYIYQAENLALTVNQFPCYPSCPDTFDIPHDHEDIYLDTIKDIESRPSDMRLFHYITDPDSARDIFIKSKV